MFLGEPNPVLPDYSYEDYTCSSCVADAFFNFCVFPVNDAGLMEGGCLPLQEDGKHVPCGRIPGDVIIDDAALCTRKTFIFFFSNLTEYIYSRNHIIIFQNGLR